MSKRKRDLTQRLEELFSAPAGSEESTQAVSTPGVGLAQLVQALATQTDPTFLATLLDHIPLPIYIKDRDHKWIAVNPGFAQRLKRTADQLIGRADKEQSDTDWQHDDQVLETAQPEETETSSTDFEGSVLRQRVSRMPMLDREGKAQFIIGIVQQIIEPTPVSASSSAEAIARNRELAAINQISQTLVAQTDLRTAIQQVGDNIRRLFNVSEAYIALYDQKTNMLELPFFIEGNQPATIAPIPLGRGLSSIVIQSRKPLLINQDTERRSAELGAIITGKQAQSYLGVPILAGDESIGVISIQSVETPGLFNDNDVQLLTTVAANVGAAIRTAQLFQEAQQAERLRVIADTTPIPILISRLSDGTVLYANDRLGPMFGLRTADLIGGITPDFYFDPDDRQSLLERVQREGQVNNYELHVKKSDGKPFWVLVSLQPMIFNGERSLFSAFYDITERKLVEGQVLQRNMQLAAFNRISQELARLAEPSEIYDLIYNEIGQILDNRNLYVALYDEATQQVSFPVYTIDGERCPVASRPFANGLTEYILRHKTPLLIPHAVDAETEKLGIANIGRSAESWMGVPLLVGDKAIGVITLQDYHQADAYTSDQLELLTTIAGQAAIALENARLFAQTQQELSERKLAEKELLKLKLGFERSNDAIFITDPEGKITYVNPGFTKVYGYTSVEAIGSTPRILKSGLLTPEIYQNFWGTLLSKGVVAGEIINKTKDGRFLTIEGNNNPIIDESGNIIGFLAVHRDISERKQTEQAVQRRADQLAALNRIGRQLVQLASTPEILETIYQSIGELIDNRNFYIALHNEGESEIYYPIYTFDNVRSEPFSRAYGHALIEHVLTTQQPVLIPHDVNGFLAQIGVESVGRVAQCWMGAPLLVGKKAIGVIALQDYDRSNVYTQADVELLTLVTSQAAIALQNTRLFTQTQARVDELAVLNQIGQAASGLLDVDELLELTYRQVSRVMRTDGFFVGLYDSNREIISYPLCYEDGEIFNEPDSHMDPDTHSYQVITTGQPLFVEYSEADRQTVFQRPETMIGDKEGRPASVIFAPLKIGERVLGVISVQSYEPGKHTPDNQNMLASIANQVAISLENARLFEQTRSRANELSVLNELAQRLSARLSIDQVLDETYKSVRRLMDAENFYIGLYDQPKHQISFLINVTQSETDREITTISADEGISGYIVRNRTSVLVGNGINQWAQKMGMRTVGQNALSWLGVPMIVGDQVLGVMVVQNYEKASAYSEHDRELLAVFANQAATAIQNALLFEHTQRDALRERTINRISAKIRNTQSVEQILRIAAEELRLATHSARSIAQIAPATDQSIEPNGHDTDR